MRFPSEGSIDVILPPIEMLVAEHVIDDADVDAHKEDDPQQVQ